MVVGIEEVSSMREGWFEEEDLIAIIEAIVRVVQEV